MKKGIIEITNGTYDKSHKNGKPYISVSFWGHNEGESSPCDTAQEAEEHIEFLLKKHRAEYDITIKDNRQKQKKLSDIF